MDTCIFSMFLNISTLSRILDNIHVHVKCRIVFNRILFCTTINQSVFFCNNQFFAFCDYFNITIRWTKQKLYPLLCLIGKFLELQKNYFCKKEKEIKNHRITFAKKIRNKKSQMYFIFTKFAARKQKRITLTVWSLEIHRISDTLNSLSFVVTMTLCPRALWTMG